MGTLEGRMISTVLFLGVFLLSGCSEPNEIMSAEFSSMDNCISGIKRNTGEELNVITDELGKISGKLSNGEHFTCETKSSGTKGIYVEGWFTVKE